MFSFNMIFFIYIPIISFLFLHSLSTMVGIRIKYNKKYVAIKIEYTLVDRIRLLLSGHIMFIIYSIVPVINILIVVSNMLTVDKYEERVIESRIEKGSLKLKEELK